MCEDYLISLDDLDSVCEKHYKMQLEMEERERARREKKLMHNITFDGQIDE